MSVFLLFYDVVADYVERRAPLRDEHLRLAREANERGELSLAGAHFDPATESFDGAVLVFTTDRISVVERFVAEDPYVREGLITRSRIRQWNVVVGAPPVTSTPSREALPTLPND